MTTTHRLRLTLCQANPVGMDKPQNNPNSIKEKQTTVQTTTYFCQAQSQLQLSWTELALISTFPHPSTPRESTQEDIYKF